MSASPATSDSPDGLPAAPRPYGLLHPLCGCTAWNWARLVLASGGIAPRCLPQAVVISLISIFHSADRLRYWLLRGRRVKRVRLKDPVFILGHWRSGTTFLHELFSRDPALGYVTTWQAQVPHSALAFGAAARLFRRLIPKQRQMDNVATHLLSPVEEAAAMANLTPWSVHHQWFFPADSSRHFERGAMLEGLSPRQVERWKRTFTEFLQMVTLAWDGRRLVLKNPENTARIPTLLEMFPGARFVFVYRNPYVVYASMVRLHRTLVRDMSLQGLATRRLEERTFASYRRLHERYFAARALVPEGRLVEIRFEDLEADPVGQVRAAYRGLGLGGFEAARSGMEEYVHAISPYRKNRYRLAAETIERIGREWAPTIERWGYRVPPELVA
jgi:hypothetical protein